MSASWELHQLPSSTHILGCGYVSSQGELHVDNMAILKLEVIVSTHGESCSLSSSSSQLRLCEISEIHRCYKRKQGHSEHAAKLYKICQANLTNDLKLPPLCRVCLCMLLLLLA